MWATFLLYFYIALVILISLFGLNALILSGLFLPYARSLRSPKECKAPPEPARWPLVSVQLPLYNEKYVANRLLDAVCAFDYPIDRLIIQILDDSTDESTEMVSRRAAHYQAQGYQVNILHRQERVGYKAGALVEGLAATDAEFIAVFDADFLPPPDFLKRTIPHFFNNPCLGMVQGRWGHINYDYNLLTRAQSIFLDGHVIVEQTARSRSGLLLNFNGSGGVWRAECIRDSGGWQWDTLSEDIDLSYRAQMKGWKLDFLPDLVVPAEIPPTMTAFKKQQYRWSFGVVQAFVKTIAHLWKAPGLTFWQRLGGTLHLSTNLAQPLGLLIFLLSIPLALAHPKMPSSLGLLSIATSGPTIMFAIAQISGYRNGPARLLALPVLVMIGIGMALSNTQAVILALMGRKMVWNVTPKYHLETKKDSWQPRGASKRIDPMIWAEVCMAVYMAVALGLAIQMAPGLIPLAGMGLFSFGYTSAMGLVEARRPRKKVRSPSSSQVEVA